MTRTLSWSPRVGEVWTSPHGDVEIEGDNQNARLVLFRGETEWVPYQTLEDDYVQACCSECGMPLTMMRKLLIDARRET